MSEVMPEYIPLHEAFVAKELTTPKTVEIRPTTEEEPGVSIIIKLAPKEFSTSLEDNGEKKVGFGIVLRTQDGQETYYRTVESPLLHRNVTGIAERNTVIEENNVFSHIPEQNRTHMARLADVAPTIEVDEDEGEPVHIATHIESGIAGNNLTHVIDALELYDGKLITSEERDVIELQLLQSSVNALENFNSHNLLHNHPHMGNFQVGKDGVIHLIDYHKATEPNPDNPKTRDISLDLDQFLWSLQGKDPELYAKSGFDSIHFTAQESYESKKNKIEAALAQKLGEHSSIAVADVMKMLDLVLLDSSLRELGITNLTESELKKVSDEIDIVISEAPTVVLSSNHSQDSSAQELIPAAASASSYPGDHAP